MTTNEIEYFKRYVNKLNASFDEYQMLMAITCRAAAQEYKKCEDAKWENDAQKICSRKES